MSPISGWSPEDVNNRILNRRVDMSDDEFRTRSSIANGDTCEICGKPSRDPDHCHRTKIYRGPLCRSCNTGIGSFDDNIRLLRSAIEYLKRYDYISKFNGKPKYEGKPFG